MAPEVAPQHTAGPTATLSESPVCSVRDLQKRYGGVHALRGVSVDFVPGQVHAILGENGAGKSTLMKILAGAESPDEGSVVLGGAPITMSSVRAANDRGISIVFQELSLFPDLDVLANLFVRREIRRMGVVDRKAMRRRALPVLAELGLNVDLDAAVSTLPLHQRQLLEIAKALLVDVRVLILDEPTSSLSSAEADRLLEVIRRLKKRQVAILFVSHRLEEVEAIADMVTVLRNGSWVRTSPASQTSMTELVADMIGARPSQLPDIIDDTTTSGELTLKVRGLTVPGVLDGVDLDAHRGEILGFTGLEDSGVQELFHTIFGLIKPSAGAVTMGDGSAGPRNPGDAVRHGFALVPADRRHDGLMLHDSIFTNLVSVTAGVTRKYGTLLSRKRMNTDAAAGAAELRVKYHHLGQPVGGLSGGNQQKIVLGKWLQTSQKVVLLDDPTRGVDLGAKLEIYQVIRELARSGCTVLFSSSELEEYRHLCRRVLVLRRGKVRATLVGDDIDQHGLLHSMNT